MALYKPLESAQHIRLLRVPASPTAVAGQSLDSKSRASGQEQYELVHVSLATCQIPYQAISYAWGDNTQDHSIEINGQGSLPITETLATALPYLVQMCSTGYLWIDQICIDQCNNEERSQQVAIMGEIYKNATEVLIWTGGELDGFAEVKARLAADAFREWRDSVETLSQLLCRPWFNRGWTIQEAVLAKKATMVAGTSSMPLEAVHRVWDKVTPLSIEQLERSRIGAISLAVILALRDHQSLPDLDLPFDNLLNILGETQMSDPRDHVYAFLGLNQDPRITIRPDYSASISEVFTHATRAIIEGTGTLDCFRFLPRYHVTKEFVLPSWVPDWSRRSVRPQIAPKCTKTNTSFNFLQYAACKRFCHKSQVCPLPVGILLVSGRIIDFVEVRLPPLLDPETFQRIFSGKLVQATRRLRFFSLTDEQVTFLDGGALTDPTQRLRKRLLSAIVAGHFDAEEMLAMYDSEGGNHNDTISISHLDIHMKRMSEYQMWITRSKRLALIPPNGCKEGDMIAILHGLPAPALLASRGDGIYAFRGQCYLEEAMFGEAVTWEEDEADILPLA